MKDLPWNGGFNKPTKRFPPWIFMIAGLGPEAGMTMLAQGTIHRDQLDILIRLLELTRDTLPERDTGATPATEATDGQ